jgi:hypothetical protein
MEQKTLKNQIKENQIQGQGQNGQEQGQENQKLKNLENLNINIKKSKIKLSENPHLILNEMEKFTSKSTIGDLMTLDQKYDLIFEIDSYLTSDKRVAIRLLTEKRKNVLLVIVNENLLLEGYRFIYSEKEKNKK